MDFDNDFLKSLRLVSLVNFFLFLRCIKVILHEKIINLNCSLFSNYVLLHLIIKTFSLWVKTNFFPGIIAVFKACIKFIRIKKCFSYSKEGNYYYFFKMWRGMFCFLIQVILYSLFCILFSSKKYQKLFFHILILFHLYITSFPDISNRNECFYIILKVGHPMVNNVSNFCVYFFKMLIELQEQGTIEEVKFTKSYFIPYIIT